MPFPTNHLLTYCTNVHPSQSPSDIKASLERYTRTVKELVSPREQMGLGVWLPAQAASELLSSNTAFDSFRAFLEDNGFFIFSINAFPYGDFHAPSVKEAVYRPDWTEPERALYTRDVADLLARLLPDGVNGSISTLAGAYKPSRNNVADYLAMASNLAGIAARLARIEETSGRLIRLGLEPEPWTTLELTSDVISFLNDFVYREGAKEVSKLLSMPHDESEALLRRHVGICFDCSHQAVMFENLAQSLEALVLERIPIVKIHLSSAIALLDPRGNHNAVQALRSLDEPRYLHQVTAKTLSGGLSRLRDLGELNGKELADWLEYPEWRCHFHIPVYLEELPLCSASLGTTRSSLLQAIDFINQHREQLHIEIETYTWDVIPVKLRRQFCGETIVTSIEREFRFIMSHLDSLQNRESGPTT